MSNPLDTDSILADVEAFFSAQDAPIPPPPAPISHDETDLDAALDAAIEAYRRYVLDRATNPAIRDLIESLPDREPPEHFNCHSASIAPASPLPVAHPNESEARSLRRAYGERPDAAPTISIASTILAFPICVIALLSTSWLWTWLAIALSLLGISTMLAWAYTDIRPLDQVARTRPADQVSCCTPSRSATLTGRGES